MNRLLGEDHKNVKGKVRGDFFDRLKDIMVKNFDIKNIMMSWSYVYYMNSNRLPIIGQVPQQQDTFIAAGYKPDDMILASLASRILVDLIITGDNM